METEEERASRRAQMPSGTRTVVNDRTLVQSHARLNELLEVGQSVLDIGCATGAITRDIAEHVAPGRVVGVDVNKDQIDEARAAWGDISNLEFSLCDIYDLPFRDEFDITTASRVLQWLATPQAALANMVQSVSVGGRVIVLDYDHEKIRWQPEPPPSMRLFYDAFLRWRTEAGMNNAMASSLPDLFKRVGLTEIEQTGQNEVARRGEDGFAQRVGIWAEVAASRGHQMVADGFVREAQRAAAEVEYRLWIEGEAEVQEMHLVAVEGVRVL